MISISNFSTRTRPVFPPLSALLARRTDGEMGGKRDTKAAKAKRAERRGKGALKTEQKTAIAEGKQERKKAFAKDEEDLDALQHSQSAARALCQLGSCAS